MKTEQSRRPKKNYILHYVSLHKQTIICSRLYFLEEFLILQYLIVVTSRTTLFYATRKRKRNEKELQRNVYLTALQMVYIRISYVGLP